MPQRPNAEKSDLSASIGAGLRGKLLKACKEDECSVSEAVRDAIRRWLSARERKLQRDRKASKG